MTATEIVDAKPRTEPCRRVVGRKILIVDDEPDLVASCVRLLERRGYECVTAQTGREAVASMGDDAPDLVLTDFNLPDTDGLMVLGDAGRRNPPIPGILMSADSSRATIQRAYESGAVSYLAKPFTGSTLLEAVGTALANQLDGSGQGAGEGRPPLPLVGRNRPMSGPARSGPRYIK
jgi:DNA-binding NtrC family response regulator